MIPIFFSAEALWGNTGVYLLDKLGVRPLVDVISCTVSKDADGLFELTLELPISDKEMPTYDSVIKADCGMADLQFFTIYRVEESLSAYTKIYTAWHISHLNNYDIAKAMSFNTNTYTASSGLNYIVEEIILTNQFGNGYNFKSSNDRTPSQGMFESEVASARETLNAYADFIGYHWTYDNSAATLTNINPDNGIVFTTRKNIAELSNETDVSELVTGYYPYNTRDGEVIYRRVFALPNVPYAYRRIIPYDLNAYDFPDQDVIIDDQTLEIVMANALKRLESDIVENITLDIIDIGDKFVDVFDMAAIDCAELDIKVKKIVVATEYDVLAHQLLSIQFGAMKPDITKTIALGSSSDRIIGTRRKI